MENRLIGTESNFKISITKLDLKDSRMGVIQLIIDNNSLGLNESNFVISALNCLEMFHDYSSDLMLNPFDNLHINIYDYLISNIEKYSLALGNASEAFDFYSYFIYGYNHNVVLIFKYLKNSDFVSTVVRQNYYFNTIREAKSYFITPVVIGAPSRGKEGDGKQETE